MLVVEVTEEWLSAEGGDGIRRIGERETIEEETVHVSHEAKL